MGFKDVYYSLEEKFNQNIDVIDSKVPVRWFFNAVDKVIPSFIFVNLLILIIIAVLLFVFLVPNTQEVNFIFKSNGSQIIDSFSFVLSVDGKDYDAELEKGVAKLELIEGEKISIESINTDEYVVSQKIYDFSENIVVKLNDKISLMPISLFLFNTDGSTFTKEANLNFSCSNADLSDDNKNILVNNNSSISVPENCGVLNISGYAEGYKLSKGQTCDSTACSIEFASNNDSKTSSISFPNGALKVTVVNDSGEPVSGARVKVFDSKDLKDEIDTGLTNPLGISKTFSNLVVGNYTVYVSGDKFIDNQQIVDIKDNQVSEVKIQLLKVTLGKVAMNFVNESNKAISGSVVLKDSTGKIIYRGTSSNGNLDMPIYSYGTFYLDYSPDDNSLFPLANYKFDIDSSLTTKKVVIKKINFFESAKIIIQVLDEDERPIQNAKLFVKDALTQFDLVSYTISNTDKNGISKIKLPQGAYQFRVYAGFSEALSETISVVPNTSGDLPEKNVKITLVHGYSQLTVKVLNEFSQPFANAKVTFYKKSNVKDGTVVTDNQGLAIHSFKAGEPLYYVVEASNYLDYYSEARILVNNMFWKNEITLMPIKENTPRVEFLGLYRDLDGNESKAMSIGNTYYLGFRIYVFDEQDNMEFKIKSGDQNIVEQDKLYFTDAYTSADNDLRYSDASLTQETLGDTKVFDSFWDSAFGVYTLYYKLNVRNSSDVKLYDPLRVNWELKFDEELFVSETKDFLAGTRGVCAQDEFCGRYTLLDKTTELYVDSQSENNYMVIPGHEYNLTFDLINGIDGPEGELKNGSLQIYNALSSEESITTVKNDISSRSNIQLLDYLVYGPNNERKELSGSLFGIFLENYTFKDLLKNRYISGKLNFKPISEKSYLNFVVIDSDRKVVVQGKPALSILFNPISSRQILVKTFPDRVLAPNSDQLLTFFVTDDTNSYVKDALVTVRLKKPADNQYRVLGYCKEILTDPNGKATCNLNADDMVAGSYIQYVVEKEGYLAYSKLNFLPDLQVTTKLFDFDKEKLNANLIYPIQTEAFDSISIINNTASDIILDHLELKVNNYSQDSEGFLNLTEMKNYISNVFTNKVILGRQLNYDDSGVLEGEAKTELQNVFKAALNENISTEITKSENVSGAVTFYFKTQGEDFTRVIPFNVKLTNDGYPTNADNCLVIGLPNDNSSFASDGSKAINIPIIVHNNCIIQTQNEQGINVNLPVTFDTAYILMNHDSGALGLGSYGFSLISEEFVNLRYSVPMAFISNWQAQENEVYGNISLLPKGVMGKENISLKLIATVQTSEGLKKIESKELKLNVSVLNIADCIKVFDDAGKETDYLTLKPKESNIDITSSNVTGEFGEFNITVKNVCEGLPIDIRICKDNDNQTPKSCGDIIEDKGYVGFYFEGLGQNEYYEKGSIIGEQELTIKRPEVSGAYALEIYAKQPKDFSYKRVKFLPVNVQTNGLYSPLFMDDPYLETHLQNNSSYESDVRKVYNIDVPSSLTITDVTHFQALLSQQKGAGTPFYIGDLADVADDGLLWSAQSAATFITFAAMTTIAILMLAGIIGGTACATGVGCIVTAVALLITAIYMFFSSFTTNIDDSQESKYIILKDKEYKLVDVANDVINVRPEGVNFSDVFKLSGQDHYSFVILRENIDGHVGCGWSLCIGSHTWSSNELKFEATCPVDYEVDTERILVMPHGIDYGSESTSYDQCRWEKEPTIAGRTVTFYPTCGGSAFDSVGMDTYVVVPCKLKDSLWGRASQGGIDGGYSKVGSFRVQFQNILFNNFYNNEKCDAEWCFKTYPVKVDGSFLGDWNTHYRVAFHNKKPEEVYTNQMGKACTDVQGNVIGFTGEDAKPKIAFEWSDNIESNFCEPNEDGLPKQYCDSTQFMISNLKHMKDAQNKLSGLTVPQCPYLNPFFKFKPSFNSSSKFFDKIVLPTDETGKTLYLQFIKYIDEAEGSTNSNNYKAHFQLGNLTKEIDMKTEEVSAVINGKVVKRTALLGTYELLKLDDLSKYDSGDLNFINSDSVIFFSICPNGQNCTLVQSVPLNLYVTAYNWKGGCIVEKPSTDVLGNGKIVLSNFYDSNNLEIQDDVFEIQDILHYRAYLMDDGFNDDFLNDFYEYVNSESLLNNLSDVVNEFDLGSKIENGQFKIINDLDNPETMGPGLYEVHMNIRFPKNSLLIKDSNIIVILNKVKSATNDNVFYYMPINGRVGINETIDRQGYGVDFTGDTITIDSLSLDEKVITGIMDSQSTPKSHIDITTNAEFSQMNGSKRGTIFEASRIESQESSNINVLFIPGLQYTIAKYLMQNINSDQDTSLEYSLTYNSEDQLNDTIILPWFALQSDIDSEKKDFTGQRLMDVYPKTSLRSSLDSYTAKLDYDAVTVTNILEEPYTIYSLIYGKKGSSLNFNVTKTSNLRNNSISSDDFVGLGIESWADILSGIEDERLCISKSGNSLYTRVFVNDNAIDVE